MNIGMIGDEYKNQDSDEDGYNDYEEIISGYNPFGDGKLDVDENFSLTSAGKIFLQVEQNGEAWYVNPDDSKRYYLGRPQDAFNIMRSLGLGITNIDLENITIAEIISSSDENSIFPASAQEAIDGAADAIRARDASEAIKYFVPEMEKSIQYNIESMLDESILALGNILSGSELTSSTDTKKVYTNSVYFSLGDQYIDLEFIIEKQEDGSWLMTNL
jgi:hypothetical protein